ncbi:hypothetical protein VTK56DRAFT_3743 [Thermocarpiscus australiensis]
MAPHSTVNTAILKTVFDEIAETNGDDEFRAWVRKLLDAKAELARFVTSRRSGTQAGTGPGKYVGFLKGSFNFSLRFTFSDGGPDAIIRFPKPGHTAAAFRDEKIANEVQIMELFRQRTTIPIPRVHSWGLTAESPQQLGPFIIMDFVDGVRLSTLLKRPTESEEDDVVLDPNIEDAVLDKIYPQIAHYMLQLSQLTFTRIGAVTKNRDSNTWEVTGRPLTYNMNELASVTFYPVGQFPTTPFDRTSDYLRSLVNEHLTHLRTQRNLAKSPDVARMRFIARQRLAQLIPKYCIDDEGPFLPFCDNLRPSNMLVDPETLRITALIDLEYTNIMPAQFTYDPPWWLLLTGPDLWIDRGSLGEFLTLYEPRMEQFVRALERVEQETILNSKQADGVLLSCRMRDSWRSGRFWFDYAIRKSFDLDGVYWAALHDGADGVELLDSDAKAEIESFTKMKMEQLDAYDEECAARFSAEN